MENKVIFIRRTIYIALFILSLVFISFRGGNLPYMLFFMMAANTVLSVIYILYVFFTVKIYQDISERRITKYESVPYKLNLYNEGIIAYSSVKLRFMKTLSYVNGAQGLECIGLEPGKRIDADLELWCKYSGTYYVGVDTIEIMDYFQIFRIRFNMPQKMKVTVKPRIIKLDNVAFITDTEECHNSAVTGQNEYLTDNEVRKYVSGDNKRLIHWKNSAKRQELMVRKPMAEEITEYIVIMDGRIDSIDFEEKIMLCDKLKETVIAMVYYIYSKGYSVISVLGSEYEKEIRSQRDFDEFYGRVTDYNFIQKKTSNKEADKEFNIKQDEKFEDKLSSMDRKLREDISFIIISAKPEELQSNTLEEIKNNRSLHIIDIDRALENG